MSETWGYNQLSGGADQVTIRPRGHSMEPLIMDREEVTVTRLHPDDVLSTGDIVLIKVRGHIYLHLITALNGSRVQIGNNHGRINGWTSRDRIAGRIARD